MERVSPLSIPASCRALRLMVVPVTGPKIEFRVLGPPELRSTEAELLSVLSRPKLLGLLAYLAAASPPGFQRRDTLFGLFWADTDQRRARGALRQSLYYLRRSIGADVLLGRGDEEVGLDQSLLWCDVSAFEEALDEGRTEEALELYRGDLLEGFFVAGAPGFETWLTGRRDTLRRQAAAGAWELAERASGRGNASAAGHWAHRATALEPLDESLLTEAVHLLDSLGDRAGAVRLYDAFARRLQAELDLDPSPETRKLIERIRERTDATLDFEEDGVREARPATPQADTHSENPDSTVSARPTTDELAPHPASEPIRSGSARPPDTGPSTRGRGARWAAVASLAAIVAVALVFVLPSDPTRLDPVRVVVTVFDNETGDPHLDPIGRMAADWISQALDETRLVDVVLTPISLAARPDFDDPGQSNAIELAEATGAGTVVLGAYYSRGDSLEIHAQIVRAPEGELLSTVPPAGGPDDRLGVVVDSLTRRVLRTLAVLTDPSLSASGDLSHPPSLEAYRQYLEGVRTFQRVPARMREALTYFYGAVAIDSTFLAPRFYLTMAHANLDEYADADANAQILADMRAMLSETQRHWLDWMIARLRGDLQGALEAARARGGVDLGVEALRSNRPTEAIEVLSQSQQTLPYYQWLTLMDALHVTGDYERELSEARRGRERYPGQLRMTEVELRALAALGRVGDVERLAEECYMLPPEPPITPEVVVTTTAAELRAHGHRESSRSLARRVVQRLSERPPDEQSTQAYRSVLARAYYLDERWAQSLSLLRKLAEEHPNDLQVRGELGAVAARLGDRAGAMAVSRSLEGTAKPPDFGADSFRRARIAALLGDRDRAVSFLQASVATGWPYGVWLHRDADLESLRGYPPFEAFIRPTG
jgi:DNA-binding SARP family transcriptional activator